MKKSLLMASLLLAGSSVMASEYFVGANYLNLDSDISISDGTTLSEKDKNINFKFGIIDSEKRVYLQTGTVYNDNEYGIDYKSTSINYDKLFQSNGKFTPFIGVGIGYGTMDIDELRDESGLEYWFRLGSLINLDNKSSFEIGYTYMKSSIEFAETSENYKLDNISSKGLYVGYNYKF